ncbi:hypothetical protein ACFYNM_18385 [Streptomyces spororaveus]|uniref:hypothetical protein n=1 Tax=Streptomyces spororaveus TaxID=284039 RepID=UPI0036A6EBFD
MLGGFANQQLARNLARSTVEGRENTVKAFTAYVNAFPWQWTPAMVDEWLGDVRSLRDLKRSTIRSYSEAIRSFCHFATDPLYEWATTCEERFGSHPIQIVHEWNTAVHVQDNESDAKKRAFTKAELHAFFAHCDDCLRLGEPSSPVPEPLAELLHRWVDSRDNMNTATNHASQWLFPGRRAGQPMHPDVLAALINDVGIPTIAGRTAAIRHNVLEMPAPVVAETLGYHRVTTAKLASEAGGTWSRSAAGNHWRSPPGWTPRRTGNS